MLLIEHRHTKSEVGMPCSVVLKGYISIYIESMIASGLSRKMQSYEQNLEEQSLFDILWTALHFPSLPANSISW